MKAINAIDVTITNNLVNIRLGVLTHQHHNLSLGKYVYRYIIDLLC